MRRSTDSPPGGGRRAHVLDRHILRWRVIIRVVDVFEVIQSRRSVRAFTPKTVGNREAGADVRRAHLLHRSDRRPLGERRPHRTAPLPDAQPTFARNTQTTDVPGQAVKGLAGRALPISRLNAAVPRAPRLFCIIFSQYF